MSALLMLMGLSLVSAGPSTVGTEISLAAAVARIEVPRRGEPEQVLPASTPLQPATLHNAHEKAQPQPTPLPPCCGKSNDRKQLERQAAVQDHGTSLQLQAGVELPIEKRSLADPGAALTSRAIARIAPKFDCCLVTPSTVQQPEINVSPCCGRARNTEHTPAVPPKSHWLKDAAAIVLPLLLLLTLAVARRFIPRRSAAQIAGVPGTTPDRPEPVSPSPGGVLFPLPETARELELV